MASVYEADQQARDADKKRQQVAEAERIETAKKRAEDPRVNSLKLADSDRERFALQSNTVGDGLQEKLGKEELVREAAEDFGAAMDRAAEIEKLEKLANGVDSPGFVNATDVKPVALYNRDDHEEKGPFVLDATTATKDQNLPREQLAKTLAAQTNPPSSEPVDYDVHNIGAKTLQAIQQARNETEAKLRVIRGTNPVVTATQMEATREAVEEFKQRVEREVETDLRQQQQAQITRFAPGTQADPNQETSAQKTARERLELEEQARQRRLIAQALAVSASKKLITDHIAQHQSLTHQVELQEEQNQIQIAEMAAAREQQIQETAEQQLQLPNGEALRLTKEQERQRAQQQFSDGSGSGIPHDPRFDTPGGGGGGVGITEEVAPPDQYATVWAGTNKIDPETGLPSEDFMPASNYGANIGAVKNADGTSRGEHATPVSALQVQGSDRVQGLETSRVIEGRNFRPDTENQ